MRRHYTSNCVSNLTRLNPIDQQAGPTNMTVIVSLRRFCLAIPALVAVSGCGSVSIDDAVPGARNTGTFPNINISQEAETEQLSDEEAAARLAALRGRRAAQKAQPDSEPTEVERLELLKRTHAEKTLEEIEN